ncbi:MAG: AAA family ATPase [Alphaproteobacteria bacterium]|nr:AAA family ATPase [Alphaproteobacteria bacterium]
MQESADRVREAIRTATEGLVDREAVVELIALAAVAREHVLLIGPPGTAKSEAVRRISRALGGQTFEYLLGRFTEPSEIFGPVDLARLREGVVETRTEGMLPEAEIAFLDEVFLGSTAILNTLLGILNERRFRRGHTVSAVPLRVCVGASNELPEDPALAAFSDRFLLRAFVAPIPDNLLEALLAGGRGVDLASGTAVRASVADLDALATAAQAVGLDAVRPRLAESIRMLRGAGIQLSDRRAVKSQRVIAAAAVLAGRHEATAADLWPLVYVVPDVESQALARDVLRDVLAGSRNAALPSAAEDASRGPAARSDRLVRVAEGLFAEPGHDNAWRLKLEGVAREIDAGFAADALPADLAAVRQRIVGALAG